MPSPPRPVLQYCRHEWRRAAAWDGWECTRCRGEHARTDPRPPPNGSPPRQVYYQPSQGRHWFGTIDLGPALPSFETVTNWWGDFLSLWQDVGLLHEGAVFCKKPEEVELPKRLPKQKQASKTSRVTAVRPDDGVVEAEWVDALGDVNGGRWFVGIDADNIYEIQSFDEGHPSPVCGLAEWIPATAPQWNLDRGDELRRAQRLMAEPRVWVDLPRLDNEAIHARRSDPDAFTALPRERQEDRDDIEMRLRSYANVINYTPTACINSL